MFHTANLLLDDGDVCKLYTSHPDKGGVWVATILKASGVIIAPAAGVAALDAVLADIRRDIKSCNPWQLKEIKKALKKFNGQKRRWQK